MRGNARAQHRGKVPIGRFFGIEVFLQDLARLVDQLERLNVAASVGVLQKLLVAGDDCAQNLGAVVPFLPPKGDVHDLVRHTEARLGAIRRDSEHVGDGVGQSVLGRAFRSLLRDQAHHRFDSPGQDIFPLQAVQRLKLSLNHRFTNDARTADNQHVRRQVVVRGLTWSCRPGDRSGIQLLLEDDELGGCFKPRPG